MSCKSNQRQKQTDMKKCARRALHDGALVVAAAKGERRPTICKRCENARSVYSSVGRPVARTRHGGLSVARGCVMCEDQTSFDVDWVPFQPEADYMALQGNPEHYISMCKVHARLAKRRGWTKQRRSQVEPVMLEYARRAGTRKSLTKCQREWIECKKTENLAVDRICQGCDKNGFYQASRHPLSRMACPRDPLSGERTGECFEVIRMKR